MQSQDLWSNTHLSPSSEPWTSLHMVNMQWSVGVSFEALARIANANRATRVRDVAINSKDVFHINPGIPVRFSPFPDAEQLDYNTS